MAEAKQINDIAIRQLNLLASHADQLDEILAASKKLDPNISMKGISTNLSQQIGKPESDTRHLVNAIDQLHSMAKKLGSSAKAIDRAFEIFGKENLLELEKVRDKVAKSLDAYNDDNPIAVSVKAQRLTYIRENVLTDAEIVTDARPIYNSDGSSILEFVITHSLVVRYNAGDRDEKIHFAIDASDVLDIRKACDRAIVKAQTLKKELGAKARVVADNG